MEAATDTAANATDAVNATIPGEGGGRPGNQELPPPSPCTRVEDEGEDEEEGEDEGEGEGEDEEEDEGEDEGEEGEDEGEEGEEERGTMTTSTDCIICLDQVTLPRSPVSSAVARRHRTCACKFNAHNDCLEQWYRSQPSACPLCREPGALLNMPMTPVARAHALAAAREERRRRGGGGGGGGGSGGGSDSLGSPLLRRTLSVEPDSPRRAPSSCTDRCFCASVGLCAAYALLMLLNHLSRVPPTVVNGTA
jgi:hypothetical protein